MPRPGVTIGTVTAIVVAVLPPLALTLILLRADPALLGSDSFPRVVIGALAGGLVWSVVVAILAARALVTEIRGLLDIAERGGSEGSAMTETGELDLRYRRLADALDERNRQVGELAAQGLAAPISDDPGRVAGHVVDTVRSVTGDRTWHLAVLGSSSPGSLRAGVYGGGSDDGAPAELTELHRWASVAAGDEAWQRIRWAEGPWGAFMIVEVATDEALRCILFAPWEGRARPSAAEVDLLNLVGQHAATAIEHALLYATVREQADELDRMSAIQRDFLRAVSHDLQTPLASIRALAGELRSGSSIDDASREDLDLIEYQADRLRRMVQQLLAMSRLEAGVLSPRQEVIGPRALVERTWAALRAADRTLDLEIHDPPLLLVADPDRLEQVVWAVLDNAVKYSPAGSRIHVEIRSADETASRARIVIRDEGPGMDPDTRRSAFDQFYRSEQARRLAPDGSGIGLYTARGLIEMMGGTIDIESVIGKGTAVVIELPAEPVEEPANASTASVPVPPQG